jgi:hypothetical protein
MTNVFNKKFLTGEDAASLALLAQGSLSLSTQHQEELIQSLTPEAQGIARALIGQSANQTDQESAQAFRDWVASLSR